MFQNLNFLIFKSCPVCFFEISRIRSELWVKNGIYPKVLAYCQRVKQEIKEKQENERKDQIRERKEKLKEHENAAEKYDEIDDAFFKELEKKKPKGTHYYALSTSQLIANYYLDNDAVRKISKSTHQSI